MKYLFIILLILLIKQLKLETFNMLKQNNYSSFVYAKFDKVLMALIQNSTVHTSIKTSFKAVKEMLEFQAESILELQKQISKKASKNEMHNHLSQKASVGEMSNSLSSIYSVLQKKVNINDINLILQQSQMKGQLQKNQKQLQEKLSSELDALKFVFKELGQLHQRYKNQESNIKEKMEQTINSVQNFQKQLILKTKNQLSKELSIMKEDIQNIVINKQKSEKIVLIQIENIKKSMQQDAVKINKDMEMIINTFKNNQIQIKNYIQEEFDKMKTKKALQIKKEEEVIKPIKSEEKLVKESILECINQIKKSCEDNQKEIKKMTKIIKKKEYESIQEVVVNSVNLLRTEFDQKINKEIKCKQSIQPKQYNNFNNFLSKQEFNRQILRLQIVLNSKTSIQQVKQAFKAFQLDILNNIETIKSDINNQVKFSGVHSQCSVDCQYNQMIIKQKHQKHLTFEQFKKFESDMNIIHQSLCYQNIVGKWSWNAHILNQKVICWDTEMINTLPDNFIWVKNSQYIKIKNQGLYQLIFGVFTIKSFHAVLYINEKQVIIINEKKNGQINRDIVAQTMNEFIYLTENSRLSIYFEGQKESEGFLCLKRL